MSSPTSWMSGQHRPCLHMPLHGRAQLPIHSSKPPNAFPNCSILQGLTAWEQSSAPFTQAVQHAASGQPSLPTSHSPLPQALLAASQASRGLLVIGQAQPEEAAAGLRLASMLGWPCIPDVLSGERTGQTFSPGSCCG